MVTIHWHSDEKLTPTQRYVLQEVHGKDVMFVLWPVRVTFDNLIKKVKKGEFVYTAAERGRREQAAKDGLHFGRFEMHKTLWIEHQWPAVGYVFYTYAGQVYTLFEVDETDPDKGVRQEALQELLHEMSLAV